MEFITKYKCEYCGEVFKGSITGSEQIAFSAIVKACCEVGLKKANPIFAKEPHIKPDHYGIGKLVGIEIVGGES